jgi:hypothetical protein
MYKKGLSTAKTNEETLYKQSVIIRGYSDELGDYIKLEFPLSRKRVDCYYFNEAEFKAFLEHNFSGLCALDDEDFSAEVLERIEDILDLATNELEYFEESVVSNDAKNEMILAYGCDCHSHRGIRSHCDTGTSTPSNDTWCHSNRGRRSHCDIGESSSSSSVSCHSGGGYRGHC